MDQTSEQLNSFIKSKYNALDEAGVIAISPADLAAEVFKEIDPESVSPMLVHIAAILELRQLSRAICRQHQTESEFAAEQESLFEFKLQSRYPVSRVIDGISESVYVLRSHLTIEERTQNIQRLRREADAKQGHADALQAETDHVARLLREAKEGTVA